MKRDRQTETEGQRQRETQTETERERQRQADRQAGRQADTQTDRQTDRQTGRQSACVCVCVYREREHWLTGRKTPSYLLTGLKKTADFIYSYINNRTAGPYKKPNVLTLLVRPLYYKIVTNSDYVDRKTNTKWNCNKDVFIYTPRRLFMLDKSMCKWCQRQLCRNYSMINIHPELKKK